MFFLLLAAIDLPLWQRMNIGSLGPIPRYWHAWVIVLIGLGLLSAERIPEWDTLQAELADYFMQRGRIADALIILERAIERKPHDAGISIFVIWALLELGQDEEARQRIDAAPSGTITSEFEQQLENEGLALPDLVPSQ